MSVDKRFFEKACQELITAIKEYDSDTFSAQGSELTEDEVYELAGRCIHWFMDNRLDGAILDCFLDDIR